jgi:hypothetical protein
MRDSVRSVVLWAGALGTALAAGVVSGTAPAASGAIRSAGAAAVVAPASHSPALSGDGRFLAFVSASSGIVPNDTNGVADIFVRNLSTGATTRATVGAQGGQPNGPSSEPAMSTDGRYVVFTSAASNLVPGDDNGVADVFRRDLQAGKTVLVSRRDDDRLGRSPSGSPTVSSSGKFVAFDSLAQLAPSDTDKDSDVFVRVVGPGTTRLITRPDPVPDTDPPVSSSSGWDPWISSNGRYVGFAAPYVYIRHDRWTGARNYPCGGATWFGVCSEPVVLSANGQAMSYQNSIPAGLYGIITYFDGRPEWTFWTDTYEVALSGDGDTVAFRTDIPVGPEVEPLYVLERESGEGPELIADHATDPTLSSSGCVIAYVLDGSVQVQNRCS